jgi:hypothetical protein
LHREEEDNEEHLPVVLDVLGELSCDGAMARPTVSLGDDEEKGEGELAARGEEKRRAARVFGRKGAAKRGRGSRWRWGACDVDLGEKLARRLRPLSQEDDRGGAKGYAAVQAGWARARGK